MRAGRAGGRPSPREPEPFAHDVAGSGPPVLLLHGLPTSRRLWQLVVPRLADRFTVVPVDLPGFGDTPALPTGLRDPLPLIAGLEAVRRQLGAERWSVAGHDAGATVAVHYAAARPERVQRLALLSPPLFPDFRPPWPFRWLRWPVVGDLLAPGLLALLWRGGLRRAVAAEGPEVDAIVVRLRPPLSRRRRQPPLPAPGALGLTAGGAGANRGPAAVDHGADPGVAGEPRPAGAARFRAARRRRRTPRHGGGDRRRPLPAPRRRRRGGGAAGRSGSRRPP